MRGRGRGEPRGGALRLAVSLRDGPDAAHKKLEQLDYRDEMELAAEVTGADDLLERWRSGRPLRRRVKRSRTTRRLLSPTGDDVQKPRVRAAARCGRAFPILRRHASYHCPSCPAVHCSDILEGRRFRSWHAVVVLRKRSRVRDAVGLLVVEESEAVERAHRDVVVRGVDRGSILPERAFDDADARSQVMRPNINVTTMMPAHPQPNQAACVEINRSQAMFMHANERTS